MSLVKWDHTVLPAIWHKWTHSALTLARQVGTRFTYPGRTESWVDLGDWLHTKMLYPPTVCPSTNTTLYSQESNTQPVDHKSNALTTIKPLAYKHTKKPERTQRVQTSDNVNHTIYLLDLLSPSLQCSTWCRWVASAGAYTREKQYGSNTLLHNVTQNENVHESISFPISTQLFCQTPTPAHNFQKIIHIYLCDWFCW